ncbi:hypothetical protein [Pedobacter sp. ASV28]|nr:hypothetical protein [Pedobacter sp. ASV28]
MSKYKLNIFFLSSSLRCGDKRSGARAFFFVIVDRADDPFL